MSITHFITREFEIYGSVDGDKAVFSKALVNPSFSRLYNVKTKQIRENEKYLAFPFFIKLGSSIVGIFSEGDAHADSDRQIIARSDDDGLTWDQGVFYENSTQEYDFSLLSDILPDGDSTTLKVWNVKNTGGVLSASIISTVDNGGITYALWSAIIDISGTLYRSGYGDGKSALFSSVDSGASWVFVSVIAEDAGLDFTETAIIETTTPGTIVAIIRENNLSGNRLYKATSADTGATWGAFVQLGTEIRGRQPNLVKMSPSNNIILCTGDRVGTSGKAAGINTQFTNSTGIGMWVSTDQTSTWGFETKLDGMYSTDGGQPHSVPLGNERVFIPYYSRKDVSREPGIYSVALDTDTL